MVAGDTGSPWRRTTAPEATGWALRTYSSTMKRSSLSRLSVSMSVALAISTRQVRVLTENQRSIDGDRVSRAAPADAVDRPQHHLLYSARPRSRVQRSAHP